MVAETPEGQGAAAFDGDTHGQGHFKIDMTNKADGRAEGHGDLALFQLAIQARRIVANGLEPGSVFFEFENQRMRAPGIRTTYTGRILAVCTGTFHTNIDSS